LLDSIDGINSLPAREESFGCPAASEASSAQKKKINYGWDFSDELGINFIFYFEGASRFALGVLALRVILSACLVSINGRE